MEIATTDFYKSGCTCRSVSVKTGTFHWIDIE
jgi:hypothetical protein